MSSNDVSELIQASLRELNLQTEGARPEATKLEEQNHDSKPAANLIQEIEAHRHQIAASFARFNAGIQERFKSLGSVEKAKFVKELAARGVRQARIAVLLGITQSAVSQHLNRRNKLKVQHLELLTQIDSMRKAGISDDILLSALKEKGVDVDVNSFNAFLMVLQQIIDYVEVNHPRQEADQLNHFKIEQT